MDVSEWIIDRFGSTNTSTLLDEQRYSTEELRNDKHKLERQLSNLESKLEKHETRYRHFLHKGVEASEIKQSQLAQKARLEKKKYAAAKKQYKQVSVKLGTVISIEGMREITSIQSQHEYGIDKYVDEDFDNTALQHELMDQMAEFGLDMEDMRDVQNALDVEIVDDQVELGGSEEMELIRQMESDDLSSEEISLDTTVPPDEAEMSSESQPNDLDEHEFDIEDDIDEETLDFDSV